MKTGIGTQLRALRKEHGMTQEQLAEALGVSVGAVSKWERNAAVPELELLTALAELFEVSLDVLVGFEIQPKNSLSPSEQLEQLLQKKQYREAISKAEHFLLRYPNRFSVVYRAGTLYTVVGFEENNQSYIKRSIELMERSISLLSQNTNPAISEASIQAEIAQCYLSLGNTKKGLEILKKYNVLGVHDAMIATTYITSEELSCSDSEPYLSNALNGFISTAIRTMTAYTNYYFTQKDYISSRNAIEYLIRLLEGLKQSTNSVTYVDKVLAPCYSDSANLSLLLGEEEKAVSELRRAYEIATAFDAAPNYQLTDYKFSLSGKNNPPVRNTPPTTGENTSIYIVGSSAAAMVEAQLSLPDRDPRLLKMWKSFS